MLADNCRRQIIWPNLINGHFGQAAAAAAAVAAELEDEYGGSCTCLSGVISRGGGGGRRRCGEEDTLSDGTKNFQHHHLRESERERGECQLGTGDELSASG